MSHGPARRPAPGADPERPITVPRDSTRVNGPRIATLASYVVAAVLLVPLLGPFLGRLVPVSLPGRFVDTADQLLASGALPIPTAVLYFAGLPLALAAVLFLRAYLTREAGALVLAVFAVPTTLVSLWALYRATVGPQGCVAWSPLFSFAAGVLLAGGVVVDGLVAPAVRLRHPNTVSGP